MASIAKRTVILATCRLLNSAILFLSPVFLVRILDKAAYGEYREFILYAYLCANLIGWVIQRNLLYIIPRYPEKERQAVTNTAFSLLAVTVVGCGVILLGRGMIFAKASFDFVFPLVVFVFCYLNLDLFESYWLAKKRSDYVLYFSALYMTLRVGAAVLAALLTESVIAVIWSLVAIEASKLAFMVIFVARRRLVKRPIDRPLLWEQLRFFGPLGLAAAVFFANRQVGALCVSFLFGPEALAVYMIGGVNLPIVNIVRSATTDVVFPEMAERGRNHLRDGLDIWKRANVVYVFFICPLFVLLFFYARLVVETVFTAAYADAVPIFQVYLLFLLRQSVEMGSPLRAANENRYFVYGNLLAAIVNIGLLIALVPRVGMIGAAVAFVISDAVLVIFAAVCTLRVYKIPLSELFFWRRMGLTILVGAACAPLLFLGDWLLPLPPVARAIVVGVAYLVIYVVTISRCHIDEVDVVLQKMRGLLTRQTRVAQPPTGGS